MQRLVGDDANTGKDVLQPVVGEKLHASFWAFLAFALVVRDTAAANFPAQESLQGALEFL